MTDRLRESREGFVRRRSVRNMRQAGVGGGGRGGGRGGRGGGGVGKRAGFEGCEPAGDVSLVNEAQARGAFERPSTILRIVRRVFRADARRGAVEERK